MGTRFRHAAIVGKYQTQGMRSLLEEIAHFMIGRGLEVSLERETAHNTGLAADFGALTPAEMGARYAISGEVQKVSNLILSVNLHVRDAATGATVRAGAVDIWLRNPMTFTVTDLPCDLV